MPAENTSHPLLTDKDKKLYNKDPFTRWRWKAKPGACAECLARDGHTYVYHKVPNRPHPNCKCTLEVVENETTIQKAEPVERIPWPDFSINIKGTATMMTVGEGADACFLMCNVSTDCIPEKRVSDKFIIGRRYSGVYKATLFGPALSATLLGVSTFDIELYPIDTNYKYIKPLHAMEGWADVLVGGYALGTSGWSASILTLGDTKSTSWEGHQEGADGSLGWYGGRGHIESYTSFECGYP